MIRSRWRRHDGGVRDDERVILFAHPRSGSSSLYQILQAHPALDILEEPFNEKFSSWAPGNKDYLDVVTDVSSFDEQLAEIFERRNGVKVLDYQLADDLNFHLLRRGDCRVVFLRRKNVLQSAVSAEIAEQTQLWKMWDAAKPRREYYRNLAPISLDAVQRRVGALHRHMSVLEAVVDALPSGQAIKLTYEGLYSDEIAARAARIDAVWDWLELPRLEPSSYEYYLGNRVKMNAEHMYAYLPNDREIDAACGSDETGWLYEPSRRQRLLTHNERQPVREPDAPEDATDRRHLTLVESGLYEQRTPTSSLPAPERLGALELPGAR